MMNINRIKDALPWAHIADHLRHHAKAKSGVEGAVFGAAFGLASAMASGSEKQDAEDLKPILAAAALGLVYGAVNDRLINNVGGK